MSLCRYLEPFCILLLSHCKYFVSSWRFLESFCRYFVSLCRYFLYFCSYFMSKIQHEEMMIKANHFWFSMSTPTHCVSNTLSPSYTGREDMYKISWSHWSVLTPDMTTFSCYRWSFLLLHFFWNSTSLSPVRGTFEILAMYAWKEIELMPNVYEWEPWRSGISRHMPWQWLKWISRQLV